MGDFKNKAVGFEDHTQLPQSEEQRKLWLNANKQWWEAQPMRYDFSEALNTPNEFSREFYQEIDQRFFEASRFFYPWVNKPFEKIVDFPNLKDKKVLEIGVGNGSHAMLLAKSCKEFYGIDLTEYASKSTKKRMEVFGISNANIQQMNAEKLNFEDNSFDLVWSWGVIHHTADTGAVLKEIKRVLKPGGKATVMVYYKSFWYVYINAGLFHGLLKGYWFQEKSLHKIVQRTIDGAIARFYSIKEWNKLVMDHGFKVKDTHVAGQKADLVLLPAGKIKNIILKLLPDSLARFFTNKCRMGYFLVSTIEK